MNYHTKREIESAARFNDERRMCEALDGCFSSYDHREAQDIVRRHASPFMVTTFGSTTYFGDVEINDWGHTCPR